MPVIVIRVLRGPTTAWPALERVSQVAYGPDWLPVFVEGTWGAELTDELETGRPTSSSTRTGTARSPVRISPSSCPTSGVENLVVTGGATNVCVESTVREGFMLGYNIVVVDDACAATSPSFHQGTMATVRLWFGRVEKAADVLGAWERATPAPREALSAAAS